MAVRTRRSFSDEQKRAIVAEATAPGASLSKVLQKHKLGESTYYNWKAKFKAVKAGAVAAGTKEQRSAKPAASGGSGAKTTDVLQSLRALRSTLSADLERVNRAIRALES